MAENGQAYHKSTFQPCSKSPAHAGQVPEEHTAQYTATSMGLQERDVLEAWGGQGEVPEASE